MLNNFAQLRDCVTVFHAPDSGQDNSSGRVPAAKHCRTCNYCMLHHCLNLSSSWLPHMTVDRISCSVPKTLESYSCCRGARVIGAHRHDSSWPGEGLNATGKGRWGPQLDTHRPPCSFPQVDALPYIAEHPHCSCKRSHRGCVCSPAFLCPLLSH